MKTVKVNEATPIQLDWLVAKCYYTDRRVELGVMGHATFAVEIQPGSGDRYTGWMLFHPTTNRAQGGPIIEMEGIELLCNLTATQAARFACGAHADWQAFYRNSRRTDQRSFATTPLVAAMRAFVASKLGDEVAEIPEELG